MKSYVKAVILIACWVTAARACDTCRNFGEIDSRRNCGECEGKGKRQTAETTRCTVCTGTGRTVYRMQGINYGSLRETNCKACLGSGVYTVKKTLPCAGCAGIGVLVTRVACPDCKGKNSGVQAQEAPTPEKGPDVVYSVKMAKVESCTACDVQGNLVTEVLCKRCEKGVCHSKEKEIFKCRKCGKVCKDRFTMCECKKHDCPDCGGDYLKQIKTTCTICGGDKIITPLEKEKAKK